MLSVVYLTDLNLIKWNSTNSLFFFFGYEAQYNKTEDTSRWVFSAAQVRCSRILITSIISLTDWFHKLHKLTPTSFDLPSLPCLTVESIIHISTWSLSFILSSSLTMHHPAPGCGTSWHFVQYGTCMSWAWRNVSRKVRPSYCIFPLLLYSTSQIS